MNIFNFFKKKQKKEYLTPIIEDDALAKLFAQKNFNAQEVLYINNNLIAAINKSCTKLVIIENFNPQSLNYYSYQEAAPSLISKIEKAGATLKIYYTIKGERNTLSISPFTQKHCNFFYKIYKNASLKKIEEKFQNKDFSISSASDFEINFLWAYNPKKAIFAYYKTAPRQIFHKLNIKKETFLIDTKYNHLELPILGQNQQLYIYESDFLEKLYDSFYQTLKETTKLVSEEGIFYDAFLNIMYLTDNYTTLQSIKLDEIKEVYYKDNRIYFIHYEDKKDTIFKANDDFIKEFDNFIISYNLRKIANNFDYKTDKIINTTSNTKFIIDIARDRIVYCANLNKLSQFTYISLAFSDLKDVLSEKIQNRNFVRIFTKDNDVIDITCKKFQIAQYIEAQIKLIISKNNQ